MLNYYYITFININNSWNPKYLLLFKFVLLLFIKVITQIRKTNSEIEDESTEYENLPQDLPHAIFSDTNTCSTDYCSVSLLYVMPT